MAGKREDEIARLRRRIAELEAQRKNPKKEPRVSNRGPGAVAEGKSVAAGKGGVAVGRVLGNIYIQFVKHTYDKKEWNSKQEILNRARDTRSSTSDGSCERVLHFN